MVLYLGNQKVKLNLNGIAYKLNMFSKAPIIKGTILLSSDNYILKDFDGLYITSKESE